MFLLFVVHVIMVSAGVMSHLLGARICDDFAGCVPALAGTLAATYPRFTPKSG